MFKDGFGNIENNWSSSLNYPTFTSGNAVMIYSYGGKSVFFLYSKSPIALVKFKFSFTLPSNI